MCVIISVYQKNKKIENTIIDKVVELKQHNSDGIGIVSFDIDNKEWSNEREMNMSKETITKIFQDNNIINIHLRASTAGKINKNNVHFWKKDDYSII